MNPTPTLFEPRPTQAQRILALLDGGEWIPLPRILSLGIAQYNTRIWELRQAGHAIENRTEERDGQRHSWYRLVGK
jgi:hypothetical protein